MSKWPHLIFIKKAFHCVTFALFCFTCVLVLVFSWIIYTLTSGTIVLFTEEVADFLKSSSI